MTDAGGVNADGTAIQLGTCNGSASQTWAVQPSGALQLSGTTRCIDTVDEASGSGTKLQLEDCDGAASQSWQPQTGKLVNAASGRCLDDPNATTADGTQLQIYDCNNRSGAQLWNESTAQ